MHANCSPTLIGDSCSTLVSVRFEFRQKALCPSAVNKLLQYHLQVSLTVFQAEAVRDALGSLPTVTQSS